MLPERITQLLSAFVDGELNARERRHVTRILRKSDEARQLYHKLQQDSMILRKLPRKKTQLDMSDSVMGTISLRNIQLPKIESAPPPATFPGLPRRRWPSWMIITIAVVTLLVLGTGSYYIVSVVLKKGNIVNNDPDGSSPSPDNRGHPDGGTADRPAPVIGVLHEPDNDTPPAKGIDPKKDDRYGSTSIRMPKFVAAQPRLAPVLALRDLDQAAASQQLVQELNKDNANRIDLFCLPGVSTIQALDRFEAVCKARDVNLRIDQYAQSRKKLKLPTNYAIYCEDLSAEDWAKLLQQLAQEDKKATGNLFDKLTVTALTPAEMAKILGGEPSYYQQPARKGPLGVDLSQDVAAKTGNEILQGMTKQGKVGLENPGGDKASAPRAVVVPYLPQSGFYGEIRHIVENRKGWRPGAIQVLLVLWNPGG
jgi:hypothetical protein